MCPNSSNGQHSYLLTTIVFNGQPVVVKICQLCQQEG